MTRWPTELPAFGSAAAIDRVPDNPIEPGLQYQESLSADGQPEDYEMFGLFASPTHTDARLGKLLRRRGLWRGTIVLAPGLEVPLALCGSRSAPAAEAVQAAADLMQSFAAWRPEIERALYEHYRPYAESVAAGEEIPPPQGLPRIESPADVGPHATALFVAVAPLPGRLITEIGYSTAWDEEHTLGVRFQDARLIELCGSVLAP